MEITEAKIKLMPARSDRLQAFCTITMDNDFVIRDIKIIEGPKGAFVAMPSRKLTDKCPKCSGKNHLRSRFCNDCGGRLDENRASKDKRGRAKLHADIAHPINSTCRERLQAKILEAYRAEVEKSKMPGYVPPKMDDEDDYGTELEESSEERRAAEPHPAPASAPAPTPAPVARAVEPPSAPAPTPEPVAAPEEEDADLMRLEEEVRRFEERERQQAEAEKQQPPKKDDFASGIF